MMNVINNDVLRGAMDELYLKIPELRMAKTIMLPYHYWTGLTDVQFQVLYQMPSLKIEVNMKTMQYIDERRIRLGLPKAQSRKKK